MEKASFPPSQYLGRMVHLTDVRLDIPVISTELRLLKLWNACDRAEHKETGLLAKLIIRS